MIDIHRILCPVDFSEPSRRALAHAVTLARWYRARLTVLHAYHVLPLTPVSPEMSPALALPEDVRQHLRGELERFVEPAGADAVPVEFAVVEGGAAREILRRAQDDPTDLIVIGTHGRTGLERFMLGSVTEKILHRASSAVLTVPCRGATTPPVPVFRRILCALDFSACSMHALEYALSLAQEANACLTIAHVFEAEVTMSSEWRMTLTPEAVRSALVSLEAEGKARLANAVPVNLGNSCTVDTVMTSGEPAQELLKLADARHADLIVLGVRGRNAADLMFFGSTTNKIIRRASCPVLAVHSR
jgi:nucleotide-binding universal stress UspA family protein